MAGSLTGSLPGKFGRDAQSLLELALQMPGRDIAMPGQFLERHRTFGLGGDPVLDISGGATGIGRSARTHLSLEKDTPDRRPIQPANAGKIVAIPEVGGLHHRYERRAA